MLNYQRVINIQHWAFHVDAEINPCPNVQMALWPCLKWPTENASSECRCSGRNSQSPAIMAIIFDLFLTWSPPFQHPQNSKTKQKTEQDWPLTSAKSGKKIHIFPTIVLSKHPRISIPIGTLAVAVTGAPPSVSMRYLGPKADVPVHQTRSATAWLFNGKLHRPKYFICSPWVHSLHISNICMEFLSSTVHVWSKPKFCSRSVRACALSNARIVCVYPTKTSET